MKIKALSVFAFVLLCPIFASAQEALPAPTPTPGASAPVDAKRQAADGGAAVTPTTTVNTPADNSGTQPLSTVGSSPASVTPERGTTPVVKTVAAKVVRGSVALPPEKAAPIRIPRFERPPTIDGKMDEDVWRQAAVLGNFYQTSPGDNIAPSKPTEVHVGYDSKFLYLAFHAYDEPGKVVATVAKRDDVLANDDSVRILIDTFNDKRKAYVLVFNPLGIQQDGIRTEGQGVDFSINVVMESKGAITADGYVVEVAVPFKSLKYEAGKGKQWGVQVFRQIQRFNNEMDSWMPLSRDVSGFMNQAGHITGLEDISTERTVDLIPSLTLSETGRRLRSVPPSVLRATPGLVDQGRFVNEPVKLDPGLTAKFAVSPTMTLDLALNPDFAQVEADQLVVTTNQRFPIFFPERRPFFLEGIEIFQTQLALVNTRAIVDPDVALKLTGRRGPNTYGLMVASDNGPGTFVGDERLDANNRPFLDKNAYIGVLRLKRDVGQENTVGIIGTTYNFIERHNHTGGVDGRFKLDPLTTLSFTAVGTHSRSRFYDPPTDSEPLRTGNGFGYTFDLARYGRNYGYDFYAEGFTNDYRAEAGFNSRVNTNFTSLWTSYDSTPKPKAKLINWHAHNFSFISYDFQGRSQAWESETNFQWFFQKQFNIGAAYEYAYERLIEEEFGAKRSAAQAGAFAGESSERSSRKNHYFFFGGYRPNKKYSASWRAVYRDGHFDYDFGGGRRFPRVSPVYFDYLDSPAYLDYLRLLPTNPGLRPPPAPALDPGRGGLFEFRGT
ncbi:MAG TPA: DUF5916 domain-containing protein, partial [Pyrinomonadaceae bacterium]|nr:DUF5916 domain-containing protein [Pyrinomonadaceae bacterium]